MYYYICYLGRLCSIGSNSLAVNSIKIIFAVNRGRPGCLPLLQAAAMPSLVRSAISLRSKRQRHETPILLRQNWAGCIFARCFVGNGKKLLVDYTVFPLYIKWHG
ncbi:hypothetical protein G7B40_041810 [Aetokthonos hydrillicola Thurmond2011]|jgi:hypothetical protein|uniref:Uncharacterized protein n=1 Tax=Aetokthonos hydrillicola Thurmond2011 TaxID=2712845 RepID=A0AAP5MAA2_9CYAN|nr:hypothetical protein [Aetokthonos hydrillicola]MDR9900951.1 hypothetical protein [Aetokthonos hydrillicola Thurmond2011]